MKLKELREKQGLSQSELGKHLGFTRSTICQYEKGTREPDYKTLLKLANYFNVTVDYLLGRDSPAAGDLPEGAAETKKTSITPIEEQMLDLFREIGAKHGKETQIQILSMLKKMT